MYDERINMSDLPTTDPQKVIAKLLKRFSERDADLTLQVCHLEHLAEQLRDERDKYREESVRLAAELDEAKSEAKAEEVVSKPEKGSK